MIRRFATWRFAALLHFGVLLATAAPALCAQAMPQAGDAQRPAARAVIVLDSANSMLNPIETFKKYYWVRKTLKGALETSPQGVAVGLVAYGFRSRTACDDVTVLRPVEPLDVNRLLAAAFSVRPRGQSPVSEALKAAAGALGAGGGKLLLIAGAGDSCQQDPCATAKDLVAAEPGLSIDVLSVGASADDAKQLQCIADAGHGHLFADNTMSEAPAVFADALAALTKPPEIAAIAPPPAPKQAAGLNLSATLVEGGPLYGGPLTWTVRKADEAGKPGPVVFRANTPTAATVMAAGVFDIEVTAGSLDLHRPVEIVADTPANVSIPLNAGLVRLKASGARPEGSPGDLFYTIYRTTANPEDDTPDTTVGMIREPAAGPLLLPAGSYRVVASRGDLRQERTLDLAAGTESSAEFATASGTLQIETEGAGDPKSLPPIYFVSEDDPDQPLGRRDVAQSAAANPAFELPPGVYHVSTRLDAGKVRLDVTVKAGEITKLVVPVSAGWLHMETQGLPAGGSVPDDLISYTVERLDDAGKPLSIAAWRGAGNSAIELEAGQYRVTGRVGLVNVTASQDVAVRPGGETRTVLRQNVGLVDLSYGDAPAATTDVLWEIRGDDGKALWSTTVAEPLVPLTPGTYTVHAVRLGKDQTAEVTLAAGERKTVAIRPE